jgi:hypothetical protein
MTDKNDTLQALKRTILQNRTKQRMALRAGDEPQRGIPKADRDAPLPLSWSQQRLWFLDQLDQAAGSAYHLPVALRLRGSWRGTRTCARPSSASTRCHAR